jgi:hypothetical protein
MERNTRSSAAPPQRGTGVTTRRSFFSAARWLAFFAVVLFTAAIAKGQGAVADDIPDRLLTNQDVIEMLGSGMTPIAVIMRIHNSPCKFDKSAAGLEGLKAAKVPYHVVLAMMKAPELPPATKGRIPIVIPDSTPIRIGLSEDLDSNVQQPGYIIYFQVLEEIRIRGLRVIAKGARVRGRLLDSKDRSRTGEAARLDWNLMDVQTVDGQRLPLRGGKKVSGEEQQQEKNVTVGKGEEFTAFTYGVRKVNVLAPIPPAQGRLESSPRANP